MNILVTGANGFIGKYVVRELAHTPHHIIATSIEPELQLLGNADPVKVSYLPCNSNDSQDNYFAYFQQPDVLIHLAWEGLPNYQELRRLPECAQRYAQATLTEQEQRAVAQALQALQRCSERDGGSQELLCFGYQVLARKRVRSD